MNPSGDLTSTIADFVGMLLRDPRVQLVLRLATWTLLVAWALAIFWVTRDALSRSSRLVAALAFVGMLLATPLGFLEALGVWMLVRPRRSLAEREELRLTVLALEAAVERTTCPGCELRTNPDWRRCPRCTTWLLAPCPRCERLVELSATLCPWCAKNLPLGSLTPQVGPVAAVPVMAGLRSPVPVMAGLRSPVPVMAEPAVLDEAPVPDWAPARLVAVPDERPAPAAPATLTRRPAARPTPRRRAGKGREDSAAEVASGAVAQPGAGAAAP